MKVIDNSTITLSNVREAKSLTNRVNKRFREEETKHYVFLISHPTLYDESGVSFTEGNPDELYNIETEAQSLPKALISIWRDLTGESYKMCCTRLRREREPIPYSLKEMAHYLYLDDEFAEGPIWGIKEDDHIIKDTPFETLEDVEDCGYTIDPRDARKWGIKR